jgi:AraC-like DNA-binding protein
MLYLARKPAPPLDQHISLIWYCAGYEVSHARERRLPDGSVSLVIDLHHERIPCFLGAERNRVEHLRHAVVEGAHSRYSIINTSSLKELMGVQFRAGGSRPFLGVPASELYNSEVALESLWGGSAAGLRERLQEAITPECKFQVLELALLARRNAAKVEPHPAVSFALGELAQVPQVRTIAEVTRQTGLSSRRLIELFHREVGMSPKLWCRVRRFQCALKMAHRGREVEWSRLAADCGYFDQSHFAHDFSEFAGITPSAYASVQREWANHVALD